MDLVYDEKIDRKDQMQRQSHVVYGEWQIVG
jgi:hypothetical protein